MTVGLPVSRLINVQANLQPAGASFANLNTALILGSSDVIDTVARIRSYSSAAAIATDFGSTAPEYLAAVDFFAQSPAPTQLYIGRWAQSATAGRLMGSQLSTAKQALSNFTGITAGSLKLAIDGAAATTVTNVNLSGATTLSGVAALITAALTGATCAWNGYQFVIKSGTTGTTSAISFTSAPGSGTDLTSVLGLAQTAGAYTVAGLAAETALAAVQACDALSTPWYALMVASASVVDADHTAIAAYIETTSANPHVYAVSTQEAGALSSASTTDIAYLLNQGAYTRTFCFYNGSDPYAAASWLGRLCTVNWLGSNTAINYMYQAMPGIVADTLTTSQAAALDAKRCNYVANYANGVAVSQSGVMSGPVYIDERTGADWLANYIQTNVFNLLATGTNGTKVPQTDAGVHRIVNAIVSALEQAATNGLIAPGVWTAGGFGQLNAGDNLPLGYYVYAPPVATQASASRAARQSPPIQVAAKFAGAVDTVNVTLNFNR